MGVLLYRSWLPLPESPSFLVTREMLLFKLVSRALIGPAPTTRLVIKPDPTFMTAAEGYPNIFMNESASCNLVPNCSSTRLLLRQRFYFVSLMIMLEVLEPDLSLITPLPFCSEFARLLPVVTADVRLLASIEAAMMAAALCSPPSVRSPLVEISRLRMVRTTRFLLLPLGFRFPTAWLSTTCYCC